jgi:PBP1b-binding outer membrane lipoprotein LpoB
MMKAMLSILFFCILLTGCQGIHFNNRSVVNYNENRAETYGTISNQPKSGDSNVAAEKTIDTATSVNTSTGSATTNSDKGNPERNPEKVSDETDKKEVNGHDIN